ncbi:hypothetical protein EC957_008617 [Mortierella hygrophila]|uniref:Uncharacterized protein n=1 Tax=Mortierella hygrophila TaxID=979708 RepID=A0A9P6JY52_9FUNG|nr:hypothetical protein EC957_008617 [Mortierella hygrophila]
MGITEKADVEALETEVSPELLKVCGDFNNYFLYTGESGEGGAIMHLTSREDTLILTVHKHAVKIVEIPAQSKIPSAHITTTNFTIPALFLTKHQQAYLHTYMSALQSLTSTSITIVSDDSILTSTTTTTSTSTNISPENTYNTVATIDLFHYPESDFKDSNRHRAYLGQKSRERATKNFIWRKIQQGAASQKDKERIERKLNQRRNKNSGSSEDNTSDEDEHDNDETYFKDDISDSNIKKSAKKALGLDTISTVPVSPERRSNKRADRRRRPEDDDYNTNIATPSLSSSASSSDEGNNDQDEVDDETFLGEEEHIRFKHNLTFKTDDQSSMSSPRVDLRSWKRAFVQRLDEQDQARSSGTESNGRSKQNKQKQKKNKGSREYY